MVLRINLKNFKKVVRNGFKNKFKKFKNIFFKNYK